MLEVLGIRNGDSENPPKSPSVQISAHHRGKETAMQPAR